MKNYNILVFLVLLLVSFTSTAQQMPQYTQYILNDFALNPAIAGTQDYYQVKSNYRSQWTGIVDAPVTYILSVYGPHKSKDMGFGGLVFNDVTGPTSRAGLYLSYAYNIKIKNDIRLSLGLSAGLLQFKIDGSKIKLHDDVPDPSLGSSVLTDYIPDATAGLYLYASKYFFGFSTNQLLNNKINFDEYEDLGVNKLANHYYLSGGYNYDIDSDWEIQPSLLVKKMKPVPMQFDINAKATYKKMAWFGLSYRTKDALSVLIGYNYQDQLFLGYSYDITLSDLKKYSKTTHEIMICAKFNKIKQARTRAKID